MNAETLLRMPFPQFRDLVEQDLRWDPDKERTAEDKHVTVLLRTPELVPRWYGALDTFLRSLDGQLLTQDADFEQKTAFYQGKLDRERESLEQFNALLAQRRHVSDDDHKKVAAANARIKGFQAELHTIKRDHYRNRVKKLRFRTSLDVTFGEAKMLFDQLEHNQALKLVRAERDGAIVRVAELEGAIRAHRNACLSGHDDQTDDEIDDALWNQVAH